MMKKLYMQPSILVLQFQDQYDILEGSLFRSLDSSLNGDEFLIEDLLWGGDGNSGAR